MDKIKRGRGRPKKVRLSDDERFEELFFKAYDYYIDSDGKLKFERNTQPLTLEETSFMVWNLEGRKTSKPLSNMMMINVERSALKKLRDGLSKYGINNFNDVFDGSNRIAVNPKYGGTDMPE